MTISLKQVDIVNIHKLHANHIKNKQIHKIQK